jgi:hypothetical protein
VKIPKAAIPRFSGTKTTVLNEADNKDLRDAILKAVPEAVAQTKKLAPYFRATNEQETCKRIFDFLSKRVKYKADDWRQTIQMPSALLRPGAIADCKSLSLFTAAILQNLGIPYTFVLASYTDSPIPGHIYVRTEGGCIIDVVWGKFNSEKKAKYKYDMQVNYLAGIGEKRRYIGAIGIGATEGAMEWAKRNKIDLSAGDKLKIAAMKINPLAIAARGLILTLIGTRNSGGLANMLKIAREEAGKNQASWDRMRAIEMKWLKAGGNPNELYEAIDKGATKTPRGKKFQQLMQKVASGQSLRPDQWIVAVMSAGFGKRISGTGIMGEPVTDTAAATASSSIWIPLLTGFLTSLGTAIVAAIASKVAPAEDETNSSDGGTPPPAPSGTPGEEGLNPPKMSTTTIILIGAAVAVGAYLYFKKKK